MTSPSSSSRSPVLWFVGLVAIGLVFAIAFLGQDDPAIGGPGDPNGTGPDGLLALRLLIEESGGNTQRNVGLPGDDIDVGLLVFPPIPPITIEDIQTAPPEPNWVPLLNWVERGGVLVTSVDVEGGPLGGQFEPDEEEIIDRGTCTISELDGVQQLRPRAYQRVVATGSDTQCFGGATGSLVVSRALGEGRIIRLGSAGALTNLALDDAENGAFAARMFGLEDAPTVGFMSRAPVFFELDPDGDPILGTDGSPVERTSPFGADQPLDSEGNPIGSGDSGLLDLVPRSVIATIIALAAALLLYAVARGRRLGSPIEEPLPIKLPSSSYVEAVGRSYARVEEAPARSANILRAGLRQEIARRVGLPADTEPEELVQAVNGQRELVELLQGDADVDDDQLIATAQRLVDARSNMDGGGVSVLARSDSLAATPTATTATATTPTSPTPPRAEPASTTRKDNP